MWRDKQRRPFLDNGFISPHSIPANQAGRYEFPEQNALPFLTLLLQLHELEKPPVGIRLSANFSSALHINGDVAFWILKISFQEVRGNTMVEAQIATRNFSLQTGHGHLILTFEGGEDDWQVAELTREIRSRLLEDPEIEMIVDLRNLPNPESRILKAIWQLGRLFQVHDGRLKCVIPRTSSIPSLNIFEINGLIEIHHSMTSLVQAFVVGHHGQSACETVRW